MSYWHWKIAAVTGGISYIIGYYLTAFLLVVDGNHPLRFFAEPRETFQYIAWVFYEMHFVGFSRGFAFFGDSTNYLFHMPRSFPLAFYLVVPGVVLILAGFLVVRGQNPNQLSLTEAAVAGARVASGYGLLALIGVLVFSRTTAGDLIARPNVGETILFMSIIYPVVLGGLGGVITTYWHTRVKAGP